jgi:hypothetical protein
LHRERVSAEEFEEKERKLAPNLISFFGLSSGRKTEVWGERKGGVSGRESVAERERT